jgi:hypothetical protein
MMTKGTATSIWDLSNVKRSMGMRLMVSSVLLVNRNLRTGPTRYAIAPLENASTSINNMASARYAQ